MMAIGLFIKGIFDFILDFFTFKERAGFKIALSPAFGWAWASIHMLFMNREKKQELLGGVK
jgi:hypothetical protein